MYELEAMAKSNPFAVWNATWKAVCEGNWTGAAELFDGVNSDIRDHRRLRDIIACKECVVDLAPTYSPAATLNSTMSL